MGNQKSKRKETIHLRGKKKKHTYIHMKKLYSGRASVLAEHHWWFYHKAKKPIQIKSPSVCIV